MKLFSLTKFLLPLVLLFVLGGLALASTNNWNGVRDDFHGGFHVYDPYDQEPDCNPCYVVSSGPDGSIARAVEFNPDGRWRLDAVELHLGYYHGSYAPTQPITVELRTGGAAPGDELVGFASLPPSALPETSPAMQPITFTFGTPAIVQPLRPYWLVLSHSEPGIFFDILTNPGYAIPNRPFWAPRRLLTCEPGYGCAEETKFIIPLALKGEVLEWVTPTPWSQHFYNYLPITRKW